MSGSRQDSSGCSGRPQHDALCLQDTGQVCSQQAGDRAQVGMLAAAQLAAFGPRQLQQALGQGGQALECTFNVLCPLPGVCFTGFCVQALYLGNGSGQWCAQLVGGIGGKVAFCGKSCLQAAQQVVQGVCHGCDFGWQILNRQQRQVMLITFGQFVAKLAQWCEAGAHGQSNCQQCHRNKDENGQAKGNLDILRHGLAMAQRLCHGNAEAALQGAFIVEPVRASLTKAITVPGREVSRIGIM